jgi:hypothetical protein
MGRRSGRRPWRPRRDAGGASRGFARHETEELSAVCAEAARRPSLRERRSSAYDMLRVIVRTITDNANRRRPGGAEGLMLRVVAVG